MDKDEALFIFKASQSLSEYPYDWEGVGRYEKTALFELTTFKDNRLLMLPHFRWDFLRMVGSYGRRVYWQVSSCGTQTERIKAKTQVLLHICASYNIIQYLLNFGETIYSHKKNAEKQLVEAMLTCQFLKKLACKSLLQRILFVSFVFRNSHFIWLR